MNESEQIQQQQQQQSTIQRRTFDITVNLQRRHFMHCRRQGRPLGHHRR